MVDIAAEYRSICDLYCSLHRDFFVNKKKRVLVHFPIHRADAQLKMIDLVIKSHGNRIFYMRCDHKKEGFDTRLFMVND